MEQKIINYVLYFLRYTLTACGMPSNVYRWPTCSTYSDDTSNYNTSGENCLTR